MGGSGGGGGGSKETKGLSWAEPILRFARSNILPLGSSLSLSLCFQILLVIFSYPIFGLCLWFTSFYCYVLRDNDFCLCFLRQFVVLIAAVTLGLTYPSLGCAVDKYNVSKLGPFGIFVISG